MERVSKPAAILYREGWLVQADKVAGHMEQIVSTEM
jgi:hypothetical protein